MTIIETTTTITTQTMILDSVPIIDLQPLLSEPATSSSSSSTTNAKSRNECIETIGKACKEWGFFYIQNHGITNETIQNFRSNMDQFFHLQNNILDKIRRTKDNSRGYFDDELTKNKLDWKKCFDFGAQDGSLDNAGMDGRNQWPLRSEHETFELVMRDYFDQMEGLSKILLQAICESLGLQSDIVQDVFDGNHTSYLRMNYYPVCDEPESHMAVHHHTDAGALTVLYQDDHVTSLQVLRNDQWHFIPPVPGAFVINIGDMIQVWSNDEYKAPLHRVQANASHERYSAPFFYNPAYVADVKPLNVEEKDAMYNIVNWGEFRIKRFAGDYEDVGEEVQISHYRTAK